MLEEPVVGPCSKNKQTKKKVILHSIGCAEGCECRGIFVASGRITVLGLWLQNVSYRTVLWAFSENLFSFGTFVPSRSRRNRDHGSDVMELC